MKKLSKIISLALAMAMLLSVTTFAAEVGAVQKGDSAKAKIWTIAGANGENVEFDASNPDVIGVTFEHKDLDGQYLIMMVTATKGAAQEGKPVFEMHDPGDGTIKYIDQVAAADGEDGDTDPEIHFDVYPSSITNSIIMIYGKMPDGSYNLKAAIVDAKYVLGDVNGDGEVGTKDVTRLARYLVDSTVEINSDAADVNSDLSIGTKDLTRLARYLVGGPALG